MIAVGVGCRREVTAGQLIEAVTLAVTRTRHCPTVLAVPAFRAAFPPMRAAAATLGLGLVSVERERLRGEQGRCLTQSAFAAATVGLASVAEAAALAAAGPDAVLLLPRIALNGVTCAIAGPPSPTC